MEIKHKISNGWVYYSEDGITIKPHFYWNSFAVKWTDIDFVCPFPTIFFENNVWFKYSTTSSKPEYIKTNLMENDAIQKIDNLNIYIVVHNYDKITYGNNIIEKFIGISFFPTLFRLFNEDNTIDSKGSYFHYQVKKKTLNIPLRFLLDLIQRKSRFSALSIVVD